MKFHEAIVYAEKGHKIKAVGAESFETFEEVKNKSLTKDELYVSDWEIEKPTTYAVPCWVKLADGRICYLKNNVNANSIYPYSSVCPNSGNQLLLQPSDVECAVQIVEG